MQSFDDISGKLGVSPISWHVQDFACRPPYGYVEHLIIEV